MDWVQKIENIFDKGIEILKGGLDNVITNDDRPLNWNVRFKVEDDNDWRGVDE